MKKAFLTLVALVSLVLILTATTQAFQIITRDMLVEETVTETDLIRLVDNFIILFDTSGSTNAMVPGKNIARIEAAKALLLERNQWLPDLGYQAGLYIYTDNSTLMGTLREVVGMRPYHRDTFAAGIDGLPDKGQGPTMLQAALHSLRKVLEGLNGKTAVILFTDGDISVVSGSKRPLQIAQEIADHNDVCFYLISSATEGDNKELLAAVSKINACSRVIPLSAFMDNPLYLSGALFTVKTTSYVRLKPVTQVVGVVTDEAKPASRGVDFVIDDIRFDFNSDVVRGEDNAKLDKLGDYLRKNPSAYVVVGGYADNIGDEEYNLALSERRAAGVNAYLVNKFGIDMNRIVTLWFGELNPVADNTTDQGRQLNRRVEIAVGEFN